jgi:chromosome segregation and condensation protein ScpB
MSLKSLSRRTGLSVGYLSRLERGDRQPSLGVLVAIREALGLVGALPVELLNPGVNEEVGGDVLARLGGLLGVYHQLELGDASRYLGLSVGRIRVAARHLAAILEPAGMTVLDDGSKVSLASAPGVSPVLAEMIGEVEMRLGKAHLEILAMVVWYGQITRRRIEEIRGVGSAESLAWLVERGLLVGERDTETVGHANVYRISTRVLELTGASSIDELKLRLGAVMEQLPTSVKPDDVDVLEEVPPIEAKKSI